MSLRGPTPWRHEALAMEIGALAQALSALDAQVAAAHGVRAFTSTAKRLLAGAGFADATAALAAAIGGGPDELTSEDALAAHGLVGGAAAFLARRGPAPVVAAARAAQAELVRALVDPVAQDEAAARAAACGETLEVALRQWRERASRAAPLLTAMALGAWDFKWPLGLGAYQATIGETVAAAFDEFEIGTRFALVNLALGPALYAARRLPVPLLLESVVTPAYLERVEPIEALSEHAPHIVVPLRTALRHCRDQLDPHRPPLRAGDRASTMRELAYAWVDELGAVRAGPLRRLLGISRPGFARLVDSMDAADALRSRPHAAGRLWSVSASRGARQRPRAAEGANRTVGVRC